MRALQLVFACSLLGPPAPDVLPPGHQSVRHELTLRWPSDGEQHVFYASPTRGFGSSHRIVAGEPFPFSSKYGTRIYALPRDAEPPVGHEAWLASPWPRTAPPVAEVSSVPAGQPLARVETALAVRLVRGDTIELEVLGERRFDRSGAPLGAGSSLPLLAIAALGGLLLLRLARRRPPAGAPT